MKRRTQMKEPYEDVMVRRKIARLEEDLKRARKEINRLAVENKSKIRGDFDSDHMRSSLKLMNEFQLDKKRLEEEVNFWRGKAGELENAVKDREPERLNTMEGINFMGQKMVIELDSFEKKFGAHVRQVSDMLCDVDINSRLNVEKSLDAIGEEIGELRKRVTNSLTLNNFNLSTSLRRDRTGGLI